MFKLPQNTVLEKRNHNSRLDLAHHSRHLCYKITYQMATANQERKKKKQKENSSIRPTMRFILSKNHLVNRDRCSRCGNLKTA